jgi:glycosyltransferase involved in cell wall biosynthesis
VAAGDVPSFSIAIGVYQSEATIGAAIESALAQTVAAREIVVCDDGSSDATAEVAESFGDRVVVLRQENRGATVAKTKAAAATTADFVVFLDGDDEFYPERIEALGEAAARRPDLDVITTNAALEIDGAVERLYYPAIVRAFPVEDQARAIIRNDSAILGAAAVRRTAFFAAGGLREGLRSGYDWELWIKLAMRGSLFGCVDAPLYLYRLHDEGASADQVRGWRDAVELLDHVLETERPQGAIRSALEESRAYHRRGAELNAAEAALRARGPDARALARLVARAPDHPLPTRAKAVLAATAPAVARRLLEIRELRSGRSRIRKPMPGR